MTKFKLVQNTKWRIFIEVSEVSDLFDWKIWKQQEDCAILW